MSENDFSPYMVTDEEWMIADHQFSNFNKWAANTVLGKLKISKGDDDLFQDILQELNILLCSVIERYKRQIYVVSSMNWFDHNPLLIPHSVYHQVQYALFCWRFRRELGPQHGFKPIHDRQIANAMDMITSAPPDFRWEDLDKCVSFLESVTDTVSEAPPDVRDVINVFLREAKKGRRAEECYCLAINQARSILSGVQPKPCRNRPFIMDSKFHPYVKRILMNSANKYVSNTLSKNSGISYVDLEDVAEMIPDTRASTNPAYDQCDYRYAKRARRENELFFGAQRDERSWEDVYESDHQHEAEHAEQ